MQNLSSRIYRALTGNVKTSSHKELLRINVDLHRRWIESQMSTEMNSRNIHFDHVKPIVSFDISKDEELRENFPCKNTQAIIKTDNLPKSRKVDLLDYWLQFSKAYQFIRLNEEGI